MPANPSSPRPRARKGVAVLAALAALWLSPGAVRAQGPAPGGPPGGGLSGNLAPPPPGAPARVERDIEYARAGGRALRLDLYWREAKVPAPRPVVLWIHDAGADKSPTPAARLLAAGYAVASVDYRDPRDARFPAQLHDLKAAVRWLRANGARYNLETDRIGAWGASAGGRLAALLGTTGDVKALEGDQGNLDRSSRVQAVVDLYGPIDEPAATDAKAANPIAYITADDAPFLIVHGTADPIVPPRQSESLQIALKKGGVENDLEYVPGAGHDIAQVQTPAVAEMVTAFFDKHLRAGQHQRDDVLTISEPPDAWIDVFPDPLPGMQFKLYTAAARGPGAQSSYRLYLPPGYDSPANAKRRYPVIYYLHGLNDDSRKASTSAYITRMDAAIRAGLMPPAIVVAVQGINQGWYVDSPDGRYPMESVIIKDLIPHIDKTYRTVAAREGRAIEGHSMGGAGALHLGFKYPELFVSVSGLAPALIPTDGMLSNAMNLGMIKTMFGNDIARYDAEGGWSQVARNADKIRGRTYVRLICGDKDALLVRSQWMSGILSQLHIDHQLIESHGAPHSVREVLARLEDNPFAYYAKVFAKVSGPPDPRS